MRLAMGLRLLPIALGCALTLAPAAPAAELRDAGRLRVTAVGTHDIAMKWRDRSEGEDRYEVVAAGRSGHRVRVPRNRGSVKIRKLERGSRYEVRVRACRKSHCGPWGRAVRTATLLAPFNGPHPDTHCGTFPGSDEFNRDVSGAPVDPRSDRIIAQINSDGDDLLHPDFGSNPSYGIPFVVVPFRQPTVPVDFTAYGNESDRRPYPIPPGAPVEGGARSNGDRHVLVVRRPSPGGGGCTLSELYRAFESGGSRNRWKADSGAVFDLGSPLAGQRPDGWTSADAAGLPIYPGLVTVEEVRSGEIDHAIRVTFEETRRGYLSPATHYASDSCDPDRPPMGLRLRLRGGYDLSGFHGDAKVIATALKRYGVINADNGSNWFISGSTDRRWNDENLNQLKDIPGSAFEVVRRSPETTPC